jgi:hypothetical protein
MNRMNSPRFQNDHVVYHDDIGDYSTNEPTMDGTAGSMTYDGPLVAGCKIAIPAPASSHFQFPEDGGVNFYVPTLSFILPL